MCVSVCVHEAWSETNQTCLVRQVPTHSLVIQAQEVLELICSGRQVLEPEKAEVGGEERSSRLNEETFQDVQNGWMIGWTDTSNLSSMSALRILGGKNLSSLPPPGLIFLKVKTISFLNVF